MSLPKKNLLFNSFIKSQFNYCPLIWMFCSRKQNSKINSIHERALRIIYQNHTTILDINYVDFLQFQRYFTPQAELEEAFIYIIHKPIDFSIDFSCRLKT